jgi:tRNA pseudouridine38-40 synthase
MTTDAHRRYFLQLAYDGSNYHGWQSQKNAISVQDVLENTLKKIIGFDARLTGCGRTDTGVHAREFFAHFDIPESLKPEEARQLIFSMNCITPPDIAVHGIYAAGNSVHARFSAISRTYSYEFTRIKDPFLSGKAVILHKLPDITIMNSFCQILCNNSDFASFCKMGSDQKTTICKLSEAYWNTEGHKLIFRITADRFLRNMVRAITGTLLDAGFGKLSINEFEDILAAGKRSRAGTSMPAHGLYLEKIAYPDGALHLLFNGTEGLQH